MVIAYKSYKKTSYPWAEKGHKDTRKYKVDWFRLIVNPLTNGSAMVILYGEGESNE